MSVPDSGANDDRRSERAHGASLTVISEKTFHDTWPQRALQPSGTKLRTYMGEELGVLGSFAATVKYKGQTETLGVLVVGGSGPSLLGRN